ncbi:MAG: hypothetical protein HC859_00230 [Bacteroidia bacterium]|nr:hypothetical protein [Bacteroidia bacterium]
MKIYTRQSPPTNMFRPQALLTSLIVMVLFVSQSFIAKAQKLENSVFWEISGKGMKKPSYLFGTYTW